MGESTAHKGEAQVSPEVIKEAEKEVESLRLLNQVLLVDEKDEGTGVSHLPNGAYGFSWSPQSEAPLFAQKSFQSFEVHKATDGVIHLIGFVTVDEARLLSTAREDIEVDFYPEPWKGAVKVVSIAMNHILHAKGPSRARGNALKLTIEPQNTPVQ